LYRLSVPNPENASGLANIFGHSRTCLATPLMIAASPVCMLGAEPYDFAHCSSLDESVANFLAADYGTGWES